MESIDSIAQVAAGSAMDAWTVGGNFLALAILTVGILFFSMKSGRSGLISLILALYAGYAIYIVFPYTDSIVGTGGTAAVQAIISIILFALATFMPFVLIRRITGGGFGSLSFVPNLVLSFLAASFLLAVGYHVFDISNIYSFPQPLSQLFAPEGYFFWWFIAPLVGIFFFAR